MRTIKIKLYSFDELTEEVQQKVIEKNYSINVDFDWWLSTYEDAENVSIKIQGFGLDRDKHCEISFMDNALVTADEIIKNHGENCATYIGAKEFLKKRSELVSKYSDGIKTDIVSEENEDQFDSECDYLEDGFKNFLCDCYANILQEESEYLQSEEAVKETLISNEYDYHQDGREF